MRNFGVRMRIIGAAINRDLTAVLDLQQLDDVGDLICEVPGEGGHSRVKVVEIGCTLFRARAGVPSG